jgi:hypothetical protein
MDTDQHGSKEISNGRLRRTVRFLVVDQGRPSNDQAVRRASALEFTIHRAVFWLFVKVRQYATSTPHAESVNSSASRRNVHRLSSSHAAAPSPLDRPQGSNRRPHPAVES